MPPQILSSLDACQPLLWFAQCSEGVQDVQGDCRSRQGGDGHFKTTGGKMGMAWEGRRLQDQPSYRARQCTFQTVKASAAL